MLKRPAPNPFMQAREVDGNSTTSRVRLLSTPQKMHARTISRPESDKEGTPSVLKTITAAAIRISILPVQTRGPMYSLKISQASSVVATVSRLSNRVTSDAAPYFIP